MNKDLIDKSTWLNSLPEWVKEKRLHNVIIHNTVLMVLKGDLQEEDFFEKIALVQTNVNEQLSEKLFQSLAMCSCVKM